jgi:EF-hand domain pair
MKRMKWKLTMFVSFGILALTSINAFAAGRGGSRPDFTTLDANSDGNLSIEEFKQLPARRGSPDELFKRMDANSDGLISQEEFEVRQKRRER